uniref:Uncharacterized protein n=1 Tax=Romanomermis culicivorax TaxID=13658 RepID=A0A915KCW1_ROMCU
MYMQGDEIWHSRCNDLKPMERFTHDVSPYFTLEIVRRSISEPALLFRPASRSPKRGISYPKYTVDFGKHLTYMYLLPEQN